MGAPLSIDAAGRIVLPKPTRDALGLVPGSTKLDLQIVAGRIELTPVPAEESQLVRRNGRLVIKPTGRPSDAAAAIRAEREWQARMMGARRA